jgi:hypothetical protein
VESTSLSLPLPPLSSRFRRRAYCSAAAAENDSGSTIQRVVRVCKIKGRKESRCLSTKRCGEVWREGLIHVLHYTPYEPSLPRRFHHSRVASIKRGGVTCITSTHTPHFIFSACPLPSPAIHPDVKRGEKGKRGT